MTPAAIVGKLGGWGCTLAPDVGNALGGLFESSHELDVASDIMTRSKCLKYSPTHFGSPWLAVDCASNDPGFSTLPRVDNRPAAGPAPGGAPSPGSTPAPGGNPNSTGGSPALPAHEFSVMNATGGVYWRSAPDWNTPEAVAGNGFYPGTIISVSCYQSGAADVPGSADGMWEQANWVAGPGGGQGWINEHFIADGSGINQPSPGIPPCSSSPSPTGGGGAPTGGGGTPTGGGSSPTYAETAGGVAHTWTNYTNAGGTEGPSIASNQTVQIACWVTGFRVADGNTYWYRIASSPWNNAYYVSADAFYNNGATSGSLIGTPFVDPSVPSCSGSGGSGGGSKSAYAETTGGVAHTWTNYTNAGGTEGPSIASNQTVQIACWVTGFRVADGNTYWYRIASSPWNNAYYVSADAFYNNGATSGSLIGTPFVDPQVPQC